MFNITESTIEWEGKALTLKTGHIGRQASARPFIDGFFLESIIIFELCAREDIKHILRKLN